MNFLFFF